jgi:hypothetical protein
VILDDSPGGAKIEIELEETDIGLGGVSMPFRSIIATPEELAALSAAFDASWIAINELSPIDPLAASAARERLGYIIVGLWKADPSQDLARAAITQFSTAADATSAMLADLA